MDGSKIQAMERACEELLSSDDFFIWRDIPIGEIEWSGDRVRSVRDMQEYYGGFFNRNELGFTVKITLATDEKPKRRPWGKETDARRERNDRVVDMRDVQCLSFPVIAERVGLSISGARYAYEQATGKQPMGERRKRRKR